MVNTVVEFRVVVDLILSVLIAATRCEFKDVLFGLNGCQFERLFEEFFDVGHGGVEGRKDERFGGGVT